ncbi:hypothetical protein [Nonomuraea sp. B1E8]|uniref:hypothetical protein n=1 Tax=unclassified Nonomuraea TaxID=2593643 RepID=UPI00325C4D31
MTPDVDLLAIEIGVIWRLDDRGRLPGPGLAAATTAAWAGLLPGTRLFYSTSADDHSSRRVAARLGLRSIGWLWKLTR